ncbi:hypothetical protein CAter10_1201 [Collimonas arenae]|nr:hypothetical protein CAter10_1201 [Collimonas arenae]
MVKAEQDLQAAMAIKATGSRLLAKMASTIRKSSVITDIHLQTKNIQ